MSERSPTSLPMERERERDITILMPGFMVGKSIMPGFMGSYLERERERERKETVDI